MGCVYLIISPSNKKYVGITHDTLEKRWLQHLKRSHEKKCKHAIYNAIRKYGKANFKLEILFEGENWQDLCEKEIYFIKELKTKYPNGYNMTEGGEGIPGRVYTEESLDKISKAQKLRYSNSEQRKILSENGKKGTLKMIEKRKGVPRSEEERKRISEGVKKWHENNKKQNQQI